MPQNLMDKVVKFNAQSAGRDRVIRLFQYGSKLVWAYLEKNRHDKDIINRLKNFEYSLSTARKLYRFGRSADIFYGALSTINLDDPTLRYTLTFSRINMALYLLTDHILWIGRVGLYNIDKAKWSKTSYKLWLYYLAMNLVRDMYEVLRILKYSVQFSAGSHCETESSSFKLSSIYNILMQNKDVTLDTIKNACDVWIPLSQLGYVSLSPGLIGLLGVISSIAGMFPILNPTCKLMPA